MIDMERTNLIALTEILSKIDASSQNVENYSKTNEIYIATRLFCQFNMDISKYANLLPQNHLVVDGLPVQIRTAMILPV